MTVLANLRASSAPWLVLPALLYTALLMGADSFRGVPGYGPQSGELAAWGVAVIAPAVAGAAAWEAGRHRRLGELRASSVRGPLAQWLWGVVPVLVLHLLLGAGALLLARWTVGAWPGGRGTLGVLHLLVVPWGWMVIGWVLGLLCPRAVAAPAAAIGSWTWLSVPKSMSTPYVRHLSGFVSGSSDLTDLVSPLAYLVPWLVLTGFAVAAVLLTGARRRPWLTAVSAVVALGAIVAGRGAVAGWGYDAPTEPRTGHTVCSGQAPVICLPREYAVQSGNLRRALLPRIDALRAAGLPAPEVLRMGSRELGPEPGIWPLTWSPGTSAEQLTENFARSAVAGVAAQTGQPDCRMPSVVADWAALLMGGDGEAARQRALEAHSTADRAELERVFALPAADQARWFTDGVRAGRQCPKELL